MEHTMTQAPYYFMKQSKLHKHYIQIDLSHARKRLAYFKFDSNKRFALYLI